MSSTYKPLIPDKGPSALLMVETFVECEQDHVQVFMAMEIDGYMPIVTRMRETIHGLEDLTAIVVCKVRIEWHVVDVDQSCQWFFGTSVCLRRVFGLKN